jgi:hypothetical protein
MGEAARLWLIIMPWAVWLSAGYLTDPPSPQPNQNGRVSNRAAILLLVLQLIVCLATVTRVTGFRWS